MRKLIDLLNARPKDRVIAAPGVYDMVSLRMAAAMGFDALYMTGYGTVASHLGLPDAGLASYADMSAESKRWLACPGRRSSPTATPATAGS